MPDPSDFSGSYNTPIPPDKQAAYQQWLQQQKQQTGRDVSRDTYDYDVQGYFGSGQATDPRGHATDQFKKPNHPTFSDESQYSNLSDKRGGFWGTTPKGKSFFAALPANLRYRSLPELQAYMRAVEPDTTLVPPPAGTEQTGLPGPPKPPLPAGLTPRFRYRAAGER